jgi:hypothetical protein
MGQAYAPLSPVSMLLELRKVFFQTGPDTYYCEDPSASYISLGRFTVRAFARVLLLAVVVVIASTIPRHCPYVVGVTGHFRAFGG